MNDRDTSYDTLKTIFSQHFSALCFFGERLINDRGTAEDIVINLFGKLWEKDSNFSRYKNIKALLYIGVKNACLNHIQTRKTNLSKTNALSYLLKQEQEDFILNEITRAELIREVYTAMQQLPPECRKVMQLYFEQGLDYNTIANTLGLSISTVRNQKARGLQLLRKKLGNSFFSFLLLLN